MSYKLDNKIWVKSSRYELPEYFPEYFPNIQNLFYERFLLADTIPHLEEDDLKNNKTMKSADFWLYEIAERLLYLGLSCVDNSSYLLKGYGYEYDSDSDSDRDWDSGDEVFE